MRRWKRETREMVGGDAINRWQVWEPMTIYSIGQSAFGPADLRQTLGNVWFEVALEVQVWYIWFAMRTHFRFTCVAINICCRTSTICFRIFA